MTIGQRIAQMRKAQGLSQEALGERLGVSRQSVYKWESDAALPEIEKLIAMSRLFEVTVGWLLGVEEEADRSAAAESTAPTEDGELTEAQLRMVREIVDRYLSAQPKPKKRRWPWLAAACAGMVLLWMLLDMSGQLSELGSRYTALQNSVSSISSSVNSQINGIADRVEAVLQSQNSLLAEESVELVGADLKANELFLSAQITPRTYTEDMRVVFLVDTGDGPVEYPAEELGSQQFAAEITCPLTDTTTVSVALLHGDTRETQSLYTQTGLYSSTFPVADIEDSLLLFRERETDGTLHFTGQDFIYIRVADEGYAMEGGLTMAKLREVQVGLFKNRELVTWLTPYEGIPDSYRGVEDDAQFYQMTECSVPVEEGDLLAVAALVTDELGRQLVYPGMAYALDEDERLFWGDDLLQDKDDWYDGTGWSW